MMEVSTFGPAVKRLLDESIPYNEISRRLGCSKATVAYHAKRQRGALVRPSASNRYSWKEVQAYYDDGHTLRDCMRTFGFTSGAWSKALARGDVTSRAAERIIPIEALLVEGRHTSRHHLKQRMIKAGLLQEACYECGLVEWRGKKLSLHLDHINGRKRDNRLENLRLLCPNCHSLTDTYGGRNKTYQSQIVQR